jgi:hypothetical protein
MTRSEHSSHHGRARRSGRWAVKYDRCCRCGTREREHSAIGLCTRCYNRAQAKKNGGWSKARVMTEPCKDCGRTGRPHRSIGLCHACYARHRRTLRRGRPLGVWARLHDRCIRCGKTDSPHHANGFCRPCYLAQ